MLTTVVIPTRRAPSPEIRARDTLSDGAANGSAGVNSAPDLGGQRCRDQWGSRRQHQLSKVCRANL